MADQNRKEGSKQSDGNRGDKSSTKPHDKEGSGSTGGRQASGGSGGSGGSGRSGTGGSSGSRTGGGGSSGSGRGGTDRSSTDVPGRTSGSGSGYTAGKKSEETEDIEDLDNDMGTGRPGPSNR